MKNALIVGAAGFLCAGACAQAVDPVAPRPNVLVICVDDMAYADMGCFGSQINRTPNMDALARRGTRFTDFYAGATCSPSRAMLMTGCYARRVGVTSRALSPGAGIGISDREYLMPQMFKDAGYATAMVGKWGLGDQPPFLPTRHGFDSYFGILHSNDQGPLEDGAMTSWGELEKKKNAPAMLKKNQERANPPLVLMRDETSEKRVGPLEQEMLMTWYTDEAIRRLERYAVERQKDPQARIFLYLAYNAVHGPHYPNAQYRGKSSAGKLYNDLLEQLDGDIGRIMAALDRLGLERDTLVMLTSDNGGTHNGLNTPLRGFKGEPWEGGMRVPTVFAWPGHIPQGRTTDGVASFVDLLPTFARLSGGDLKKAQPIDGKDISDFLTGKTGQSPRTGYCYIIHDGPWAVREGQWKLFSRPGVETQLYDLKNDVGEQKNVAAEHPDIVARLKPKMDDMLKSLGYGRTMGPECRPAGAFTPPKPVPLPAKE